MRKALVKLHDIPTGILTECEDGIFTFTYFEDYHGPPISLTMPLQKEPFEYVTFPSFFEGLLPEGVMLEGLLRNEKLDRMDYFGQLFVTGEDLVGAVTVHPLPKEYE